MKPAAQILKQWMLLLGFVTVAADVVAQPAFSCDMIKDKAVRASCLKDFESTKKPSPQPAVLVPQPVADLGRADSVRALRALRSVAAEANLEEFQKYYLDAKVKVDAGTPDAVLSEALAPYTASLAQWRNELADRNNDFYVRRDANYAYAAQYPNYMDCMLKAGFAVDAAKVASKSTKVAPFLKEMSACLIEEGGTRVAAIK